MVRGQVDQRQTQDRCRLPQRLGTVVLPKWETVKLRDIDHGDIQGWVSWLVTNPAARQRPAKREDGETDDRGLSPSRVTRLPSA